MTWPTNCEHAFIWLGIDTAGNDQVRCERCGFATTVRDRPPSTGRMPTAIFPVPKSEPNLTQGHVYQNPAAACAAPANPNYVTVQIGGAKVTLPKSEATT